jgi:hypothetical protein
MKKTLYIILAIIITFGLVFLALWQVNKFSERKTTQPSLVDSLSVKEYNQLLESLAPNPSTTSTLSEEEYGELIDSLAPSTSTTAIDNDSYKELIKSLEPQQ